jgi:molecular chaperone DnaJ
MLRCNMERALNVDDCYHELGVAPDASDAEVKGAWRRLAARWHPDRNDSPHALRKIQRINQAIEEIYRSRCEMRGEEGAQPDRADESSFEHTVHLTLEEVASGCVRELRGEVIEHCGECEGSGLQVQPTACAACAGTGRVSQPLWFAWLSPSTECVACHGHGATRLGCTACAASGKAPARNYRCRVAVPRGLRSGSTLDVTARVEGRQRRHHLAIRVRVEVVAHEFFDVRQDGTLTCELPVDGFAWMANRWVDVPTARGLQQMRLRRGALNYRIKGAGLPWLDDESSADCVVNVVPIFPEEFSPEQEAAIDHLVSTNSGSAQTEAGRRLAAWTCAMASWQARMPRTQ